MTEIGKREDERFPFYSDDDGRYWYYAYHEDVGDECLFQVITASGKVCSLREINLASGYGENDEYARWIRPK